LAEKIIIKFKDLDKEAKKILNHIQELEKSRDVLFKTKNYPMCIAISVLISEEIAKMHMIISHKNSKKDIGKTEWKSMYKHKQKLSKPYVHLVEKIEKLPIDKMAKAINKVRPDIGPKLTEVFQWLGTMEYEVIKSVKLFDELKQDCFYVSERQGKLFSISNNLTEKQQEKLAFWISNHSKTLVLGVKTFFDPKNGLKNYIKHFDQYTKDTFLKKDKKGHEIFDKIYYRET